MSAKNGHGSAKTQSLAFIPLADLKKRIETAIGHVDAIESALPPLIALTDNERRTTDGRLRQGEAKALAAVVDVADSMPTAFTVLADKDGGVDPKRFETDRLRDALARADALDELATSLEELARDVRDSQLALGGDARSVILAAYEIAKPIAKHDDGVRAKLAPALNYYSAPARQAARTRAERRKTPSTA